MILRGTVYLTCHDQTPEPPPFPRAVLQEDAHDASGFMAQVLARLRARWPRRSVTVEFGPIGEPWSRQ